MHAGSNKNFKRNEIVRFKSKTGRKIDMKFARYLDKNMATLRFTNKNKKGTINVNLDRIEKMPKRIANTKLRQKTRRANLVRKNVVLNLNLNQVHYHYLAVKKM